jgi:hypothetical protein
MARNEWATKRRLTQELKPMDPVSTPTLPSWTSSWNLMGSGAMVGEVAGDPGVKQSLYHHNDASSLDGGFVDASVVRIGGAVDVLWRKEKLMEKLPMRRAARKVRQPRIARVETTKGQERRRCPNREQIQRDREGNGARDLLMASRWKRREEERFMVGVTMEFGEMGFA